MTTTRCAVYCRKSTDEGLEQAFNSLDAQRESAEHYIAAHAHEGWAAFPHRYDDGGFSGGNMDRPAMKRLMADIEAGEIDCVVVYKIDRLSRSLLDFVRIAETFEQHGVAFVSVTQHINSSTSAGRLMMNVLLSFAQFEREVISERTRDKIAATRRRGMWSGGRPILGFDVDRSGRSPRLVVNEDEAARVVQMFNLYLEHGSLIPVVRILNDRGWRTKRWTTKKGREIGGLPFDKTRLHALLTNKLCIGKIGYKTEVHEGEHDAIITADLWRKVQAQLQRNGRTGGTEARNKHAALLRGLVRCAPCGCAMTHSMTKKQTVAYRYYVCNSATKRGWDTCPSKSVPAAELERFVVDEIRCIGRDPTLVADTVAAVQQQAEDGLTRLAVERPGVERDLARVQAAINTTTDPPTLADLHDRIQTHARRLQQIDEEVAALRDSIVGEAEVRAALADFDGLWSALTPREQCRVLQLLVERVDYDGRAGTVSITFRPVGIRELQHTHEEAA